MKINKYNKPKDSSRGASVQSVVQQSVASGKGDTPQGGGNAAHADTADYATVAGNLDSQSTDWDVINEKDEAVKTWSTGQFLSKVVADTAAGFITFAAGLRSKVVSFFEKGIHFGEYTPGALGTGGAVLIDQSGNSTAEFDYITIRKAAFFREITIKELRHVGGEIVLSAAAMKCSKVVPLDTNLQPVAADSQYISCYKCYFDTDDAEGNQIVFQEFVVGDLARCQAFSTSSGNTSGYTTTKYYWRKVIGVGTDYIILSNVSGEKDANSTSAPEVGDNIVQLGYTGNDNHYRKSAIILSATDINAPSMKFYQGITTFTLPSPVKDEGYDVVGGIFHSNVYGKSYVGASDESSYMKFTPGDGVEIKGKVQMSTDSTIGDTNLNSKLTNLTTGVSDAQASATAANNAIDGLSTGNENLVVNGGFAGLYESESVNSNQTVNANTQIFSDPFGKWTTYTGCTDVANVNSATGRACQMVSGTLTQTISRGIKNGETYTFSVLALSTGSLTVKFGSTTVGTITLVQNKRCSLKVVAASNETTITLTNSGTITISEIQLIQGNVTVNDWTPSPEDNCKYLSYYKNFAYLMAAIEQADTQILGGLILTQMIRVGNYANHVMTQETGGMSGSDANVGADSPFLWGGGDMTKAIAAITAFASNPLAEFTSSMAKFVVTHGGRAILNDIIARGAIIATSGIFKNISTPNGKFSIDANGNMACQDAKISGNMYTPLTIINATNFDYYVDSLDVESDATNYFTWRSGGTNSTHQGKASVSKDATTGDISVTINNNTSGGRFGMLVSDLPVGFYKIEFDCPQELLGGSFYTNYNNSTAGASVAYTAGGDTITVEHHYENGHYWLYIEKKTSGTFYIAYAVASQSPNTVGHVIKISNFRVTKRKSGRSFGQFDYYGINLERTGLNIQIDYMPAHAVIELPHDDAYIGAHLRIYNNSYKEIIYSHYICRIWYDQGNVYTYEKTHILGHAYAGNYVELMCFDDTTVEEGSNEWTQKWIEIAHVGNDPQYSPSSS